MFCSKCGAENQLESGFCIACGNPLQATSSITNNVTSAQIVKRYGGIKAFFIMGCILPMLMMLGMSFDKQFRGTGIACFIIYFIIEFLLIRNTFKKTPRDEWGKTFLHALGKGCMGYLKLICFCFLVTIPLAFYINAGTAASDYTAIIDNELIGVTKIGENLYKDKKGNLYS